MISIASKALFLIPILFFLIVYQKFILGFGIGVLLRDSRKTSIKLSIGETLMHSGMSLLTLMVENIRISSTSAIFYVVGFLKFTAMRIGIFNVIPWLLFRNKAKDI